MNRMAGSEETSDMMASEAPAMVNMTDRGTVYVLFGT